MRVFLNTWVLVKRYKGNPGAIKLLSAVEEELDAHISQITVARLVNVIRRLYGERQARIQYAYLKRSTLVLDAQNRGMTHRSTRPPDLGDGFFRDQ